MKKIKNYAFFLIYLLCHPRLFLLFFRGIHIPAYLQYRWIRGYPIKTIIDVGAYTGQVSMALHVLLPNALIYAFEPVLTSFAVLKKWAETHNDAFAINSAVSDKTGDGLIYINSFSPASSLLRLNKKYKERYKSLSELKEVKVRITPLDAYFKNRALESGVLLKVDTQGSELSVLRGARKLLKEVSIIHIETVFDDLYLGQANFSAVYKYLVDRGFVYNGSITESDFYPQFDLQRQQNSVFFNKRFIKLL